MKDLYETVRKLDYTLSDDVIKIKSQDYSDKIAQNEYDFSKYLCQIYTQGEKKRKIYSFDRMSVENVVCHYLKKEMDNIFNIKYASRAKIINLLMNTLPVIKNLNDFVIIRADFKSFFETIYTKYVYEQYIQKSLMSRKDKEILKKYTEHFKYCYAGLCLSNGMAEIVCRDFDKHLFASLEKYGIFYYERYVDDIIIMLNSFISKDTFLNISKSVIKEVFGECPVKLNENKFSYITQRYLNTSQKFDFLGYEFEIKYTNNVYKFTFGITDKKRQKYKNIIEKAFIAYKNDNDIELFRQRLKIYSARIVIARSLGNNNFEWLTKGITANYNELRFHINDLDGKTKDFLENTYINLLNKHNIQCPYFLKNKNLEESIYNMYSALKRNRSIVFEKRIGVARKDIIKWIKKIEPNYSDINKNYYQVVIEYLELLKNK